MEAFGKAKLGMWLKKPVEQNCFVLDFDEPQWLVKNIGAGKHGVV